MTRPINRRSFLTSFGAVAAALAVNSLPSRLTKLAFAQPMEASDAVPETLMVVFLRGGWDALNVVVPLDGADRGIYEQNRPNIKVPIGGANSALSLDGHFGLHPAMAPLHALYQAGKLAVIQAAGLQVDTRSHFDAQNFIELGTPGVGTTPEGWLARLLHAWPGLPSNLPMPALAAGGTQILALQGLDNAVAMNTPSSFTLNGHWKYELDQRAVLRDLYSDLSWLGAAGMQTLDTVDLIESANPGNYTPANGAAYPAGTFGSNLQTVAQIIKMKLGLRVAAIDVGGWDTHISQGNDGAGYLADNQLKPLGQGLAAFLTDLTGPCGANFHQHTTIVVLSEFGRRLKENADRGTDHGHGNVQLVLGGGVNGGKLYGQWPGLKNNQLYDGADLAITTDFRRLLSEIITARLGNFDLGVIFPGYTGYSPLGAIQPLFQNVEPLPPPGDERVYLPLMAKPGEICQ